MTEKFHAAMRRFDEENSRDPNREIENGDSRPRELVYSEWLSGWLLKREPDASEALRLAARCQHLRRWERPRETYPMTRAGYLKWREDLKHFHAEKSGEILREVGYGEEMVKRVRELNLKKDLANDREVQVLEDALCLVFLERQLGDLAAKTSEEKVIAALRKSWEKMSPLGREMAMTISFGERERELIQKALL